MSSSPLTIDRVLSRGVAEVLPNPESLAKLMGERKIRIYLGIDPTGPLLTLGHSVVLRKLQQFAELGHEVILLIGNGTVKIGDPTGRDTSRPVMTDDIIEANFKDWKNQASKILDFTKITIRHNGDWLDKLNYSDMVKLMAQTTVQQLIERDMFQERLKKGHPIFGHEIMYPILQGYDSVVMDVDVELGGTDQTFNMLMGRTLQRSMNQKEKWVLSLPLINGTDGRKMSKSMNNYIALMDAPNEMFGKLMSISDDLIIQYFTLLTDTDDTDIQTMEGEIAGGANPMPFKKRLAHTITTMYHSEAEADAAQEFFSKTVQNKEVPDNVVEISLGSTSPTVLDILKLCLPEESSSHLRRLIEQGGVELVEKGEKLSDPYQVIELDSTPIIRAGKRNYFKLKA